MEIYKWIVLGALGCMNNAVLLESPCGIKFPLSIRRGVSSFLILF